MARSWRDVRSEAVESGLITERGVSVAKRGMREAVLTHRLAEIRKAQGPRQRDVAEAMGVSQARVSKLERGNLQHTELGTLDAYVAALGGHLKIVADFGDSTVELSA